MASYKEWREAELKKQAELEAAPTERLRTFLGQGVGMGFGDELEAGFWSLVTDRPYEEIRDEIRNKLDLYKEARPAEAFALELGGAAAPALIGGPAYAAIKGTTALAKPTLLKAVGYGALEGGVSGAGFSEEESAAGIAKDIATGAVIGGVAAPVAQKGLQALTGPASSFQKYVRTKLGARADDAVQAELIRMQEKTGKSVDQIVDDIANGRLMIENETLALAMKNYVNEGGEAGAKALDVVKSRAGQRKADVAASVQQEIAPGYSGNIARQFGRSQEDLQTLQGKVYDRIFAKPENQVVSDDLANVMLDQARRFPEATKDLNKLYTENNLVPLFTTAENGELLLARAPSLEDTERLYRQLRDLKTQRSKDSGTGLAGSAGKAATELKEAIDAFSPELGEVRLGFARREEMGKMYEEGAKALSKNPEDFALTLERLSKNPEAVQAFRLGAMHALRRKFNNAPLPTLRNLATEDKDLNQWLKLLSPDADKTAKIIDEAGIAAEVGEMAQKMPTTAGSPTAGLQKEQTRSGIAGSIADVGRLAGGDLTVVLERASDVLARRAPELTDAQRLEVVNVLASEYPDLVRRALENREALDKLMELTGYMADRAVRRAAAVESGATVEDKPLSVTVTKGLLE